MQNTKACGEISFFLETTKKKDRFLSRSCVFAKNRKKEGYEMLLKTNRSFMPNRTLNPNRSLNPNQSLDHKRVTGKGRLRSWRQLLSSATYCCENASWNTVSFLSFFYPSRACARTLQQFCTFCFHNLHRNPCKVLKDYTLRGIFRRSITLFQKNRRKVVEKCSKNEKKWQESFPKRVRPTQKKHTRNLKKAPTFFGKTPTFFKKSPTFFLERRRNYPNLKSVTSGGEVWRLWKQKVQNPREGARVTRAWGKVPMKGCKMEQKRPAISSDKVRKEIRNSQIKIREICKVNKAFPHTHKEKTALFRRFLSLCLIWHPYSIEGDEIEKQQKKCS